MDYDKAKRALDALSQECQAQNDRLQLAAEAKAELDKQRSIFLAKYRYNDNRSKTFG